MCVTPDCVPDAGLQRRQVPTHLCVWYFNASVPLGKFHCRVPKAPRDVPTCRKRISYSGAASTCSLREAAQPRASRSCGCFIGQANPAPPQAPPSRALALWGHSPPVLRPPGPQTRPLATALGPRPAAAIQPTTPGPVVPVETATQALALPPPTSLYLLPTPRASLRGPLFLGSVGATSRLYKGICLLPASPGLNNTKIHLLHCPARPLPSHQVPRRNQQDNSGAGAFIFYSLLFFFPHFFPLLVHFGHPRWWAVFQLLVHTHNAAIQCGQCHCPSPVPSFDRSVFDFQESHPRTSFFSFFLSSVQWPF